MPQSVVTILDVVIGGLLMGGLYAVIAMGFSLQYGVARVLNIAHGEFIMISAYLTWVLFNVGVNPLLSLVIVGPAIFLLGYALQRTLFTRLRASSPSQGAFEGSSMLATFGLMFIMQNVALLIWGGNIQGYSYLSTPVNLGGAIFQANRLVSLGFAVVIGLAFYFFLARTRVGKGIRAAAQDSATAELMGVNINQVLALCFGLGALMAACAGLLISMCFSITPTMGLEYTVIAIIVVVLGGLGSIPGSFIGGLLLGLIGNIVTYFEPGLALPAYYFIFIVLLMVKPTGIMGR
ncbi:MAG: branched-chain amino acid ABC transporter permease [Chloroflexi bacterium]|jgi:branched-chain amino acid transport system permease protein|nr:branched-chain amino acid ABC transporter permease [Chloroflexota bacterium]